MDNDIFNQFFSVIVSVLGNSCSRAKMEAIDEQMTVDLSRLTIFSSVVENLGLHENWTKGKINEPSAASPLDL